MRVLECKSIRQELLVNLKEKIDSKLTLVVIQIGDFKENEIYLRNKKNLALELGVELVEIKYDENILKEEIISKILELNLDASINGIMIQKPILPKFNYQELVNYIDYRKDVDGVTKINKEKMYVIPCTVRSVLSIFEYYKINTENKKIAIVGKSDLVGLPLYNILKKSNDVVLCDSKTVDLKAVLRSADIIVSAIGKANYFDDSYFSDGQIIIDVGTNYLDGRLVGDVNFNSLQKNILITSVPGGVGAVTPIYLFWNLYKLSKKDTDI